MRTIILSLAWLSLSASALSQNLVAYYPFNGNNNDESGNSINPTYTGAGVTLTTDRFGNANKAYNFDGATGSYMRMPADLLPTTNRTISMWFNVPDVTNRPGLLGYGGNGSCGTTLLMGINCTGSGQYWVQGHCGNNAAGFTYPTAPVNNWYHWVLTINGSAQKIYVNGKLKSTTNSFSGSTAVTGKDFSLGVITSTSGTAPYTDVNVGYLNGKLDDIRIYDNAMTDAQVQNLYNSEVGMVAYYPFNGNANDETGNGNNSTYIGAGVTLTSDRFGNANSAYQFDGYTNSYIRVPADNFPTTDRTISFWFNTNELSNFPTPLSYGGNGCNASSFLMIINKSGNSSYLTGGHCDADNIIAPYTTPPLNSWKQWVMTISGPTQKIFINGVLQQTTANYNGPTYVSGRSAIFGGLIYTDGNTVYSATGYASYFSGKLDDIRIYHAAMSDVQVHTLYIDEAAGGPLPVTLLNLQVSKLNTTTANISWQTATEINNRGFQIQRSFDGINFTDVKFVTGAGNSDIIKQYSITDIPGSTGIIYYRLKQVDIDGNSKLSNTVIISFNSQGIIKVYPNPAQQQVTIEGIDCYNRLQLIDITGKRLNDIIINKQYQININLDNYLNGFYFIRLMNEKETKTIKLTLSK